MKTYQISLQKYAIGLMAALVAMMVSVAPAAAATYYYQPITTPYYYSNQQPVYQYQLQNSAELIQYLQSLLAQLQQLQNQYRIQYGHSYGSGSSNYYGNDYDIDVDTLYARDVDDEEATLYGEVDTDNAPYVDVWFEYGEGGDLDEESKTKRVYNSNSARFSIVVDDLDEDENYYFRAVAEDPNGDVAYGQIKSFDADDSSSDDDDDGDEPDVETGDADDIEDDSATISGEVDMNDFDNGDLFFVYGEDEDLVDDVDNEDSYNDIDEEGDDLQKYKVYSGLDNDRTVWLEVSGLDDNTDYYYRMCVEYEDEDGDDTLTCGDVEHFETD